MEELKIDFVVTWLDNQDPEWQASFEQYCSNDKGDKSPARYRDMDIFRYWFRAVEMYAPWVHKVYLITNGKFPDWINKDNPKLVLVKHEDYIPKEFLPTFNSRTIEFHMHRIKGLSEHFVYFNDDMFLNSPVKPDCYFKEALPCDINMETFFNVPVYSKEHKFSTYLSLLANIGIINGNFNRWDTVRQSPKRWFGLHLGIKGLIMSLLLLRKTKFIGFVNFHVEQAYLKSSFCEVWEKAKDFMNESCTRVRQDATANPYIFQYWQFATNRFYPQPRSRVNYIINNKNVLVYIDKSLQDKTIKSICLNDACPDEDFDYIKEHLQKFFQKKFPHKSSFEK